MNTVINNDEHILYFLKKIISNLSIIRNHNIFNKKHYATPTSYYVPTNLNFLNQEYRIIINFDFNKIIEACDIDIAVRITYFETRPFITLKYTSDVIKVWCNINLRKKMLNAIILNSLIKVNRQLIINCNE